MPTRGEQKKQKETEEWKQTTKAIKAGGQESMLSILEKRGYINQIVGKRVDLDELMIEKRVGIYTGIDPTGPSLHVGHLVPLMVLFWTYCHGYHSCSLLGGATAKIGDPTDRDTARAAQNSRERKTNMVKIHVQLQALWQHAESRLSTYGYKYVRSWKREMPNNNHWLNKLGVMEFLSLMGPGMRLGPMLGRDHVKSRMHKGDGLSVSEFLYPVIQAWDWWHMYQTKDIQVQVGGSDQFGNILAGMDAINYINSNHPDPNKRDEPDMEARKALLRKPMGFTVPLLTTASGEKFGKSAGNAVWLDPELTSPFDLYKFFLSTADADVHRYLKLFTFEPLDVLEKLMETHNEDRSKRIAQHKLALDVLKLVHDTTVAKEVAQAHARLFRKGVNAPQDGVDTPQDFTSGASAVTLPKSLVYDQRIHYILYHAGLASSRSEAHRLVTQNGAYVMGINPVDQVEFHRIAHWAPQDNLKYISADDILIFRVGKSKIRVVTIISDEDFETRGLTAPGWNEWFPPEEPDEEKMPPKAPMKMNMIGPHQKHFRPAKEGRR